MLKATKSQFKIMMGTAVLIDVNDWLLGEQQDMLKITPEFPGVESVNFLGGGGRTYERGGVASRFHTLEFSRIRNHSDVWAAQTFQMRHMSDLPAGGQDVVITQYGINGSATLYKASIVAAPSYTVQQFSIVQYQIRGAMFTSTLAVSTSIKDEAGVGLKDEANVQVLQG